MGSPRDYKNTIVPNWCPGCGDFGIQNAIAAVCAAKGWPNEDIVLISGIGCSSRLPYYLPASAGTSTATAPTRPMDARFLLPRASNAPTKIFI